MGERGKPTEPAATHKRRGTYQPGRHSSPGLPVEIPEMPGDLSPRAQAVWKRVSQHLYEAGLIASIDQDALRLLCESYEQYLEASDEVRNRGMLVEQTNNKGKKNIVLNPAWRARKDAWAEMYKMFRQFGMTPSARTGLGGSAQQDEADPIEQLLSRRKKPSDN